RIHGARAGAPAHVLLPSPIGHTGGNMSHGQSAGFLGSSFDPFVLNADPAQPGFRLADSLPAEYFAALRTDGRSDWRSMAERVVRRMEASNDGRLQDADFHHAYSVMSSEK